MSSETKLSPQNVHSIAMAGKFSHSSFGTCKLWFLEHFIFLYYYKWHNVARTNKIQIMEKSIVLYLTYFEGFNFLYS